VRNKIEAETVVDAKKQTLGRDEALVLAKTVKEIYATKGTKQVHIRMWDDAPTEEKLVEAMLGPTGNLRAPTIKCGDTLIIGFSEELFAKLLGSGKAKEKVLK
jgi:hypothetical protein